MLLGGLAMTLTKYKLGELITQRREKYDGISDLPIRGVSKEGFISAKQPGADTSIYNVYYLYDFVFNPARMEINSIALNTQFDKAICSSLYEIFYVSRPDVVLPEYLNLFIKRDEFARRCEFIGWGSAREYCRVGDISDIDIELPSVDIQRKYVDIYNAILANQRSYERGLEDLKLVCDGYIEKIKRTHLNKPIGKYLFLSEKRNECGLGVDAVRGLAVSKEMIPTKADMDGVRVSNYKLVPPRHIAYVPDTSRRGDKVSLGFNNTEETYMVSSISTVFTTDEKYLLPDYLMLFFTRSEFDRYARFHSWGSARETFDWDEMCDVEIPVPDIKVQQYITNIYVVYQLRKEINEQLKAQIKNICPILIKGSIEEASV